MVRSAAKPRVSNHAGPAPPHALPPIDLPANPLLLSTQPQQQAPGQEIMKKATTIRSVETLACDAGWRNYHFVKIMTEDGIVGWSEYDEGFGAPGVTTAIERLAARVV